MTRILLVRCAAHDRAGTLVGRNDTVGLSRQGVVEATALALRLAQEGLTRLQSSPQHRTRETATLIAARVRLEIETADALDDMDFGTWSGLPLIQLERDDGWYAWNRDRESSRPPDGEDFAELQRRIVGHIAATCMRYPDETVAMITHLEPIRAAVLDQRNLPLDAWEQINVAHGSLVEIGTAAPRYSAVA